MKTKLLASILVWFSILASSMLGANALPRTMPIANEPTLRAALNDQAVYGRLQVWAQTMLPGSKRTVIEADSLDKGSALKIMDDIDLIGFSFLITKFDDPIYLYGSIYDEDGAELITGWTQFVYEKTSSGWSRPADIKPNWTPAYYARIPVSGVQTARLILRNAVGEAVEEIYLGIENGKILFPSFRAGYLGELIVTIIRDDGTIDSASYSLSTGKPLPVLHSEFKTKSQYGALARYHVDIMNIPMSQPVNIGAVDENMLIVVESSVNNGGQIHIHNRSLWSKDTGQTPLAFYVWKAWGEGVEEKYLWPTGNWTIGISVKGRSYIRFDFGRGPTPVVGQPDNGKGSVEPSGPTS